MSQRSCLSVILAAGEGTRMKSALPKVLHPIAGLPMVAHVVKAAEAAGSGDLALVIGHGADEMRKAAQKFAPNAETFVQEKRLGTAHAVLAARAAISKGYDDILVMFGDTPLIDPEALAVARQKLAEGAAVVVVGFRPPNPTGYGRLIEKGGRLVAIREEKDCSDEEKKIGFCNAGMMAVAGRSALELLDKVGNANAKGEFYLTDIVEIAGAKGLDVVATEASFESALGINNRAELAEAEGIWQARRRREAMLSGVTLIAPETVYFSHDTEIGADTVVEPNVWFGLGVKISTGATIHAFSHMTGATIAENCEVGPFARLRPGTDLRKKAKVGNFCEVKQATVEEGAKVNHLTYIGDARVGAAANIGAGTITCNYDGYSKFFTDIGEGAFVGSNSSLVAPITIGKGSYIASGSVLTENVPDDALAFGRARQKTIPGKGKEIRERFASAAAARKK
ncbi:bifunctional UDP-N-acetylglucosamine diphosphorylase/glucosamine-1-phosphate N-acetyltransferase GlmU [Mesorhizobium sp. M4B.F.Ca.ET.215.01.1.1]|uniref:bifunctional UDP-N-acetylglucosamine diphosphorylase/glucosamine-1-phosphate N-acetyltransferase GlmU n=1 Tax=unclassified Mesorhizobium TaxID=325217 RepID=UPI000FCBD1DA|nr:MULTISPECIES: bifunctional UDP-N-acetylglucosamine diphosphorylase/glucosamine-1-phosphate N-acetyltransferase GlmU [unclassified Mesorhizobium]RVD40980.1 bifunctional UDP-N-acetylglucosamine diphosphorylase/glucosamine-1-phosphate N-acetyltransferase GlmU [Mesorhizobium sp. M4B.F.Ca.ET.019.03.1.1]RWF66498.1 MAG: bifunctional UDP-N-acetylglucosamine diphosphorylase/glucosamine-1-phosphate N-acetyltransferase GlmU [Mesorhizobium sp.]TGQ08340.1 bifunctional UDP-N-acetylglucosamine diphosphoryla